MTFPPQEQGGRSLRRPPHSIEAEESVLGAVLLSSEAINTALEKLHSEDFYHPSHQLIFEAITSLFDANEPIDAVTVAEQLRRSDSLDKIGGIGFLTKLLDSVPVASSIDYYAGIVEEHALRRRLMNAGGQVAGYANEMELPLNEVLDLAEQSVYAVSDRRVGSGLALIDPVLGQAVELAELRHQQGGDVTGISTGYLDIDKKLGGFNKSNLIILAARPGMGKTALALNIAQNVGTSGLPVAVFSLEMSREEIVTRMLCAAGRIDSQKLRTGQLTDNDFTKLSRAANELYKKPIYVDDSPGLTVTEIRAKARRLARRPGLSLIVVDYIQLMQGSGAENRQQEISEISRNLKSLARELEVPVLALSQLNRALESREDRRPRLGDLRESGAIEQDADIVMFIYRNEYYHPEDMETRGTAELIISKHRQGSVGVIHMTFFPEFTLFGDLARVPVP
ncbi:MAG: replicative DNA helicase [Acidobacteria bacterium]|nr:replicative DNA helicase [Acidobacteriota bacterium]MCH8985557.1 replicative DNA helicase [Acidobacteriota bacterium]